MPGLRRITQAVHAEGCPIFVQIHHAGIVGIAEHALCPSAYQLGDKTGAEMSVEQIHAIQQAFIRAAQRAYQAGYDGVELHGCHRYLMCQFLNRRVNTRADVYGEHPEQFVLEILEGIRKTVPEDFVVGIRLGRLSRHWRTASAMPRFWNSMALTFWIFRMALPRSKRRKNRPDFRTKILFMRRAKSKSRCPFRYLPSTASARRKMRAVRWS